MNGSVGYLVKKKKKKERKKERKLAWILMAARPPIPEDLKVFFPAELVAGKFRNFQI